MSFDGVFGVANGCSQITLTIMVIAVILSAHPDTAAAFQDRVRALHLDHPVRTLQTDSEAHTAELLKILRSPDANLAARLA